MTATIRVFPVSPWSNEVMSGIKNTLAMTKPFEKECTAEREVDAMAMSVEKLALELLELPASSRALLAAKLIASLDEVEDPESEALWIQEAERRYQEIREGKVASIPAEDVFRDLWSEPDE